MARAHGEWLTNEELIEKLDRKSLKLLNGCIEWQGAKTPKGYGQIAIGKQKQKYAHRISYLVHNGVIPKGLLVCHSCDNPSCVNPKHLWLGTSRDNLVDMYNKGRGVITLNSVGINNTKAKLTEKDVLEIRASTDSKKNLAAQYKVSNVMISYILLRRNWSHI